MQLLIDGKEHDPPNAGTIDELIASLALDGRFITSITTYPDNVPLSHVYLVEITTAPAKETRESILGGLRELSADAVFVNQACAIGLMSGEDCTDEIGEAIAWWQSLIDCAEAIGQLDGQPWHPDAVAQTLAVLAKLETAGTPEEMTNAFESLADDAEKWHRKISENS